MNMSINAPKEVERPNENEVKRPNENEKVLHTLPDSAPRNKILELFKRGKSYQRRLSQRERRLAKVKMKMKDRDTTVYLSGEINIDSVEKRMKEHMEAYPTTADGFCARFIDHTDENTGYIVVPCNKNEKDSIHINGLYYRIYPFGDHPNKLVNIFAKDLCDILRGDMSEDEIIEIIKEKIIRVLKLSPFDEEGIIEIKDILVDFLLQDPKFLNTFGDKKYLVFDCINKAFSNI